MAFRAAGIEGLRGVAACAVVVAHTGTFLLLPGVVNDDGVISAAYANVGLKLVSVFAALGVHGVTVFFVISGFLLYRPFVNQVARGRHDLSVREFLRNRVLRIFPAYLVIFSIAAFALGAVVTKPGGSAGGESVGRMTDPLLIVTNLTLTHGYLPEGQVTGLGASWSLVPELAFYLLLPVVWLVARRLAKRWSWQKAVLAPVFAMLVVGLVSRLAVTITFLAGGGTGNFMSEPTWRAVIWRSILTQGDLFAIGMVAAVISVHIQSLANDHNREKLIATVVRRSWWLLVVGVLAALPTQPFGLDAPVLGLAGACIITLAVFDQRKLATWGRKFLESRVVERAGMISYSIYLWHVPVIFTIQKHVPELRFDSFGGFALTLVIVLAITWVLSELTYALIERPALSRKRAMVPLQPSAGASR